MGEDIHEVIQYNNIGKTNSDGPSLLTVGGFPETKQTIIDFKKENKGSCGDWMCNRNDEGFWISLLCKEQNAWVSQKLPLINIIESPWEPIQIILVWSGLFWNKKKQMMMFIK